MSKGNNGTHQKTSVNESAIDAAIKAALRQDAQDALQMGAQGGRRAEQLAVRGEQFLTKSRVTPQIREKNEEFGINNPNLMARLFVSEYKKKNPDDKISFKEFIAKHANVEPTQLEMYFKTKEFKAINQKYIEGHENAAEKDHGTLREFMTRLFYAIKDSVHIFFSKGVTEERLMSVAKSSEFLNKVGMQDDVARDGKSPAADSSLHSNDPGVHNEANRQGKSSQNGSDRVINGESRTEPLEPRASRLEGSAKSMRISSAALVEKFSGGQADKILQGREKAAAKNGGIEP